MLRKHVSTRRRPHLEPPRRPPLPVVLADRHVDDHTGRRHAGSFDRCLWPAPAELRGQQGPDRFPGQLPGPGRRLLGVSDAHRCHDGTAAGRRRQRGRHEARRGQPYVPPRRSRQATRREQLPRRQRPLEVAHQHCQLRQGGIPGCVPRNQSGLPRRPAATRVRLRCPARGRSTRDPHGVRRRSG